MPDDATSACLLEPVTIKHLADAVAALNEAERITSQGFVADHCENARREIRKAIVSACGADE